MPTIITITLNPALDISFEVERLVRESKLRGSKLELHPGGGGINVARAATRLGADVEAAWLGGGGNGAKLTELLDDEGVRHHCIPIREDVRMSIHVEERTTTDMYRFVLPGAGPTADELAAVSSYVATTSARYVVLSGSLPASVPVDFYARLAERVPPAARVILDTSGDALDKGLAGKVFVAKPNRNELGRLLGKKLETFDDVAAAGRELIAAQRVEALAVSMGEDGMLLVTADRTAHIRAPRVEMVSAVGAGDSTVAGLVVGLSRGLSLHEAARLGVASGTAAVLTPGSELIRRDDVERIHRDLPTA